mmetsp:Transcript_98789/g.195865  ORF Transcript_98789/g.195865 Transcript_98789/m.195865 type:complete len:88 (+) Transcript_98789:684-947(+)
MSVHNIPDPIAMPSGHISMDKLLCLLLAQAIQYTPPAHENLVFLVTAQILFGRMQDCTTGRTGLTTGAVARLTRRGQFWRVCARQSR